MSTEIADVQPSGLAGFAQTSAGRSFFLMLGIAAVIGVMASVWMWGKQPDYRVLFSNFSDRDGGSIVASLQQLNIPYKFADGGSAILVPAEQVYDARLKLAAQGLPKGGNVGFELMENQKLGISQFLEQVNFQRALEGELARSIQSVGAVQSARVHLALPKASVFVRDQQKPTASVLLNLHPGRPLDRQQVSAIVHLVASSVPELPTKNVTVVDQHGNLLSDLGSGPAPQMLDPTKLQYLQDLQQGIAKRVESIILPIVGAGNVRAEATAEVDFTVTEQASETYKPNQGGNPAAVRSQQSSESQQSGTSLPGGVPGALANQPPAPNTAPMNAPAGAADAPNAAAQSATMQKDTTVNYELDKSIQYVQQHMGSIKRLSVAVVVNHKREVGADGSVNYRPLTEAEQTQITDLVREAMGFNKDRGDSLSVVNTPFAGVEQEVIPELPLWKQPQVINWGITAGKYLLAAIVLAYLFFAYLRPMLRRVMVEVAPPPALPMAAATAAADDAYVTELVNAPRGNNLTAVKQIARDDPKMVANIVKSWVDRNE